MEIKYKEYGFKALHVRASKHEKGITTITREYYCCVVDLPQLGQKHPTELRRDTFEELELAVQIRVDGLIRRLENKECGHHGEY